MEYICKFSSTGYWGGHFASFRGQATRGIFGCFRGQSTREDISRFREQATGENIWSFSRTCYWDVHLEFSENRLIGRTFAGSQVQVTGEDIWSISRRGYR